MGQLQDKVAIVTGAARGLGRAYAQAMAREGAAILACDVNSCDETVAAIAAAGGQVKGVLTDVSSMASCTAMATAAVNAFGRIDVLVNNAGLYGGLKGARFEHLDEAQWDAVMNINVKGLWQCCKAVVEPMRAAGGWFHYQYLIVGCGLWPALWPGLCSVQSGSDRHDPNHGTRVG